MPESPDKIVRRWFKEVWDEGREESIDALLAPYAVAYGLPGGPLHGPTAFKRSFACFVTRSVISRSRSCEPSPKGTWSPPIAT